MNNNFQLHLPPELNKEFTLAEILLVKKTSVICSLKKMLPFSEDCYILKIIPANQYDRLLYEKLSSLSDGGILTAVQEYHTRHFIYFIFPKLQSLSYLVKSGQMDFHQIKTLYSDIGKTLLALHKADIFHMDISPDNIYLNPDGHYILGDFSSARIKKERKNCFKPHLTGSTKGFYPENIPKDISPANYDVYGFFMILFLLLHFGKTPSEIMENSTKTALTASDEITNDFEQITAFLSDTLYTCKTVYLSSDFFEKKFFEFGHALKEVKEQKIRNTFRTKISDFENSLFCSFTEPEEESLLLSIFPFFLQKQYKTHKNSRNTFENRPKIFSIPKSMFSKESISKPVLYGFCMFCGFLFLFACYHTLSNTNNPENNVKQVKANMQTESVSGSQILSLQETKAPPVFQRTSDNLPINTDAPTETSIPVEKIVSVLDLEGQNLKNTSFLSKVKHTEDIQIIFAAGNHFSNVSSFFSFQNLKELYLNQNYITSVQGIKELKHLEVLDLSENKVQELSALSSLKNLKILDLSGQKTLNGITALKKLKSLEYLLLTNTNATRREISVLKQNLPACTIFY